VRILLADDDEQLRRALRITLTAQGYEVLQAHDGAEAIDLAANGHPDLIVLDLGMPRVDGIDVIRAVRAWSSVPILVLSGRTDSTEKVEALDAGADDYVTKPFAMDEFLARIRARSRRPTGEEDAASVRIGDLDVDLSARTVRTPDGRPSSIRQADDAADAARRGVGPIPRERRRLPAALHGTAAEKARTGAVRASPPHHRARHGISLRPVSNPPHGILTPDAPILTPH
jgi:CheY-like chemotaxis protein